MDIPIGLLMVLAGGVMLLFGPRIARARISLHYSHEELRATSGPSFRKVRRARIVTTALTMLVGAAWLAAGIYGLIDLA